MKKNKIDRRQRGALYYQNILREKERERERERKRKREKEKEREVVVQ